MNRSFSFMYVEEGGRSSHAHDPSTLDVPREVCAATLDAETHFDKNTCVVSVLTKI